MRIFILDKSRKRQWGQMVPKGIPYEVGGTLPSLLRNTLTNSDLVIVHRTDFLAGETVTSSVAKWVNKAFCYVLFVAGVDSKGWTSEDGRVYRRKARVRPSGADEQFAGLLEQMCRELHAATDRGTRPRWEIVEPAMFPEYLVSAYLVRVARAEGVGVHEEELPSDLWEKAQMEYALLRNQGSAEIGHIRDCDLRTLKNVLVEAGAEG